MTEPDARPPAKAIPRVVAYALGGIALIAVIATGALTAGPSFLDRARPGEAVRAADGVQEIRVEVAEGVYTPNVIRAHAGLPLRLHVVVRERHACSTLLLVPDLKAEFDLPSPGEIDLTLPPAPAGSYLFTCGKKMVKGSFVLE